jgi:hypothetical protein
MQTRQRFKQTKSFQQRLSHFIADARAQVEALPEGADKTELLKKVQQAEAALDLEKWANSPGLQPPK